MFTTTLLVALAGFLVSTGPQSPSWHADYGAAQVLGKERHKPLAVFVGSGKQGWNQITRDGQLDKDITELLAKTYICVYVDTAQEAGKELASELAIPQGPGLVVSDHTGKYQAFYHQGDLASDQLLQYLRRYADPERLVRMTETNPSERPRYTGSAPSYYQPMRYAPAFSGSC
ncbi:MAG TPA: hypothetical protein VKU02_09930 [Gemmataceae bacterium]|nr:hypothetical protein [Gemmataceae bacterium]